MSVIVASPHFQSHLTGLGHPESPDRYRVIQEALQKEGILTNKTLKMPARAQIEDLLLCHTKEYVELVFRECASLHHELRFLSTGDVVISEGSLNAALLAVGAVLTAVDCVMKGEVKNAFCLVRPPGHHATRFQGMGFCLFNNVAIGAKYLQSCYGIKKVAIIDWDVHHGNGTEDIVRDDPSIFYFSTHQEGIYPGTGTTSTKTICNVPLAGGVGSRTRVFQAFEEKLIPLMDAFQPEFVFISCGFDGHREDPLGGFDLTDKDFYDLTEIVKKIAHLYAKDRIVSVLEGGYNLQAIARASLQHVKSLLD